MMSDKSKYFNGEDINIDGGWAEFMIKKKKVL